MNNRIISVFLILCCFTKIFGQTEKDIVGIYSLRGGEHYIKADHHFIIIGYGTIITGTWSLKDNGIVLFTPDYEKEAFTLYGRHNKDLNGSAHVMVSYGFYDEETFLHFGTLKNPIPTLKRVFKEGHRCISFPYIVKSKSKVDTISFSFLPYAGNRPENIQPEIYTFYNTEKYNQFIAIHHEFDRNNEPFTYQFKENKLFYEEDAYGEKREFEEKMSEEEKAINDLDRKSSGNSVYFTPLYNECESTISESIFKFNYKFDKRKNAYVDSLNYTEGEERRDDYDFNNKSIIYKYDKLTNFIKFKSNITIEQTPIFIEKCH
jgi:hypothetical protein